MTDLVLVNLDNDKVVATVTPKGKQIEVTGPSADTARRIVEVRADLMGKGPGEILDDLADYGWSNGHLVLRAKE